MARTRNRDFFKLVEPFREVFSEDGMIAIINKCNEVENILYRPDKFGDSSRVKRFQIRNKKFRNVSFSWTKIENCDFRECTFEMCIFNSTQIIDCEFHQCNFIDTNTHKIRISSTYIEPRSFDDCLMPKIDQNIGTHLYQKLMNNAADEMQPRFYRYAVWQFNRWSYLQSWYEFMNYKKVKQRSRGAYFADWLARRIWSVIGAGVFLGRFFLFFAALIFIYSTINYILKSWMGLPDIKSFWDSLYFTIITLTTIGFGDITPEKLPGRAIVAIQGVSGFFVFATSASMIFRRVAP